MTPTFFTGVPSAVCSTHDTKVRPDTIAEDKIRMFTLDTPVDSFSSYAFLLKMVIFITRQEER